MFFLLLACGTESDSKSDETIFQAPIIQHSPTDEIFVTGDTYGLTVTAQDDDGIYELSVHYRVQGEPYFDDQILLETKAGDIPKKSVLIGGQIPSLQEPAIEYYFSAVDNNGSISLLPSKGPSEPFVVEVTTRANPLPFSEDFTLGEDEFSLFDLDWWTPCDAREVFSFSHVASEGNKENGSAFHARGLSDIPELSDWLISPPLDFSDPNGAMVRWFEMGRGDFSLANHELYISTGARLPEDGDYQLVQILDVPEDRTEGEWLQHSYIDLSQWAGEDVVYLAWRWQGVEADDWYLDDVEVVPLAPDLSFSFQASGIASSTSSGIAPGGNILLTLDIANNTSMGAEGLIVDAVLPQGGGQLESEQFQTDALEGNGQVSSSFNLFVSEDTPNYQYLPVEFHIQTLDGALSWVVEERVLLGEPSTIDFTLNMPQLGVFDAFVGVGDPENPIWTATVYSDPLEEGLHSFQYDITEQQDYLPPVAGEERWYLAFRSSASAQLSNISLQSHGQNFEGSSFYALDEIQYIYFPKPPNPILSSVYDKTGTPGETIYPSFSFSNVGAEFSGVVRGTLSSSSSSITISSPSSIIDSYWSAGESQYWSGPSLSISGSHKNNQNIPVELVLEDEIESWLMTFDVEVPWPVIKVLGVVVEDDDNQVLDPDESSEIEISVANVGGLDAFGFVTGQLELLNNSGSADVSVENLNPSFGFLDVGESDDSDNFSVQVTGGAIGDVLEFSLSLDDGTESYEDQFSMILGEAPWLYISPFSDTVGDTLDTNAVDFERVEMRYFNNNLEMRITAANTIDQQSFIEMWGSSNGATYPFYRWVLQGGTASLQGYDSGFFTIADVEVDFLNSNQVLLRWDPSSMGLSQQSLRVGLGSGWCGPPEYFCDHFPDGWGYPYVSYSDQNWFSYQWQ